MVFLIGFLIGMLSGIFIYVISEKLDEMDRNNGSITKSYNHKNKSNTSDTSSGNNLRFETKPPIEDYIMRQESKTLKCRLDKLESKLDNIESYIDDHYVSNTMWKIHTAYKSDKKLESEIELYESLLLPVWRVDIDQLSHLRKGGTLWYPPLSIKLNINKIDDDSNDQYKKIRLDIVTKDNKELMVGETAKENAWHLKGLAKAIRIDPDCCKKLVDVHHAVEDE